MMEAKSLNAREVLRGAWPLFQVSLPGCLPLAVIGVAASGVPGAEAVARGEAFGQSHSADWWGLYFASTVLMLICYGGVLRQQLSLSHGRRTGVMDSLRSSLIGLPGTAGVVLLSLLAVVAGLVLLVIPGLIAVVYTFLAWPAQVEERLGPIAALRRSVSLVRGRFTDVAAIAGSLLAAVIVFVMLSGVLMDILMNLAGPGVQTGRTGMSLSRWLMVGLLSLPVTYTGAVTVTAWNAAIKPRA
jgi:hypothetical protein